MEDFIEEDELIIKNTNDVLDDLNKSEEDRIVYKSVIVNLEKELYKEFKNGLVVAIPTIGRVRRHPIKLAMRKHHAELKQAYKQMSVADYKEYAKSLYKAEQDIYDKEQYTRKVYKKYKKYNKKQYEQLIRTCGNAYAELWIKAILMLEEVPFDQDVQDAYDSINDK